MNLVIILWNSEASSVGFLQPSHNLSRILVGRKYWVPDMFHLSFTDYKRASLDQWLALPLKNGQLHSLHKLQILITQQVVREVQSLLGLLLVRRILRTESEHCSHAQCSQRWKLVAIRTSLAGASARAGRVVPFVGNLLSRCSSAGTAENNGKTWKCAQLDWLVLSWSKT